MASTERRTVVVFILAIGLDTALLGQEETTLRGHNGAIVSIAFSPDAKFLASGSADKTVKVWDLLKSKEHATFAGHVKGVACVSFSPDGKKLAAGSVDGRVLKLWDVVTGQELANWEGLSVAISPDGSNLASGGSNLDPSVRVRDIATGKLVTTLSGHSEAIMSLAFSADGQTLATASSDRTVRLWKVATGQLVSTLHHNGWAWSVAFSPDGKTIASAAGSPLKNDTGEVKVWNAETGAEVATLRHAKQVVSSVAFSPDGKKLATASWNNGDANKVVTLWNAETWLELAGVGGGPPVAFSPNGRTLAFADGQTVKLLDLAKVIPK